VPFHLVVRGQDELRAHLEAFYAAFPDIKFVVTGDAFVAGDRAAVEWTATGTYTGQIPGMPPGAGQTVTFRGASILELQGDKVRVEREYYDAASLLAQLGALPAPGTPTPEEWLGGAASRARLCCSPAGVGGDDGAIDVARFVGGQEEG
jgi:steroid delta-isomerase-like uncharacterized protein